MIDMISMQVQWLPPGSIVKEQIFKGSIKSKFCIMKNKQEIDCIFRKVRSFKKYVKCKRRDRVKAKMKPCITAHMTAFSLLLSFGKWAFFCLPTDCLHFCTRSLLPDPCFFASRVGHSHFVSRCKKVVLLMISDPTFAINFLQCFLTILQRRYSHRKVVFLKDLAGNNREKWYKQ